MLCDALDGTAFAGGVATFEDQQQFKPLLFDMVLKFQQLDLQSSQLFAVLEGIVFILILVAGLAYVWRKDALEWV